MSEQPTNGETTRNDLTTKKDPTTKLVRKHLSVLELAKELKGVAEAYQRSGMDRISFYEYKRRFQFQGFEGLKDLPPVAKFHPQATSNEVVQQIVALALEHPSWGCNRISDQLAIAGIAISFPTVQNILNNQGLGTRYEQLLKLEERGSSELIMLSEEQLWQVEKTNPAFWKRGVESSRPGELLCQNIFYIGQLKGIGKIYLHTVVDTFGSYAFGFLYTTKQPEAAVAVVHNEVLPFYQAREILVEAIQTDNGREFCGTERHPYELYLELNDINHRCTKVKQLQTNGFVERFLQTVRNKFFSVMLRQKLYASLDELQQNLDLWLVHYNMERAHQSYRNMVKRPMDAMNA